MHCLNAAVDPRPERGRERKAEFPHFEDAHEQKAQDDVRTEKGSAGEDAPAGFIFKRKNLRDGVSKLVRSTFFRRSKLESTFVLRPKTKCKKVFHDLFHLARKTLKSDKQKNKNEQLNNPRKNENDSFPYLQK